MARRAMITGAVGCAFALATLGWASAASAEVRYAEPAGNGPEPCLSGDPCDIQIAVEGTVPADVENGDEVVLLPGDYNVGSAAGSRISVDDAVDVHGATGQPRPRIFTGADFGVLIQSAGATLSDVAIEHTGTLNALNMSGGTVERVFAHSIGTTGFFRTTCLPGNGLIRDSVCWNSGDIGDAIGFNFSGGAHDIDLRNVTAISTAAANAYGMRFATSGGGTTSVDAKSVIARGATGHVGSSAFSAINDITLDHSNFATSDAFGTGSVTAAGTPTNTTGAPVFLDAASGDFRQAVSSTETIDRGAVDGLSGALDLDGTPRTQGTAPDIGADEFAAPVPDGDGDGVPDASDACPAQLGPPSNNGCPEPPPALDTTPPETTIDAAPKRKSKRRKASIAFSSSEPGSTFECSLDRGEFAPCESPFKARVKRVKHRFEVRATDPAGNVDASPAAARWRVLRARAG